MPEIRVLAWMFTGLVQVEPSLVWTKLSLKSTPTQLVPTHAEYRDGLALVLSTFWGSDQPLPLNTDALPASSVSRQNVEDAPERLTA